MCLYPRKIKTQPIYVACGRCIECKMNKSREWSYRIALESKLYKENCFITLTYAPEFLPENGTLVKKDLQDFLKRFRFNIQKKYNKKIRFFACGEYGKKFGRPHYHLCIFGFKPDDLYLHGYDNKKTPLYRSPFLEKAWKKGFSSVIDWNDECAIYCAKYLQKRIPPKDRGKKIEAYTVMSNRPGIGVNAICSEWLKSDKVYLNGKYTRLPRYFLDKLEKDFPEEVAKVKEKRFLNADFWAPEYAWALDKWQTPDDFWQYFIEKSNERYKLFEKREKFEKKLGYSLDFTTGRHYNKNKNNEKGCSSEAVASGFVDLQLNNAFNRWLRFDACRLEPVEEDFDTETGELIVSPFEEE